MIDEDYMEKGFELKPGQSAVVIGEDGKIVTLLLLSPGSGEEVSAGYLVATGIALAAKYHPDDFYEQCMELAVTEINNHRELEEEEDGNTIH